MTLTPSRIEIGDWSRWDRKTFVVTIGGSPSDVAMRFQVMRQAGGAVLLEKTTAGGDVTVGGADDEEVSVVIGGTTDEELLADYADLPAGDYWWELYDTETPLLIAYGDAHLGEGTAPDA